MNITIRKSTVGDYSEILTLINEFASFQRTPERVSITLEQMILSKDYFQCFVAEADNKIIVGFASFFFTYYSWSGKAIYLDDLYVREDFRKYGIGKKLLDAVVDLAISQACVKVRWQVSKWNTNAIEFYKKIGAAIDETEINCDLNLVK